MKPFTSSGVSLWSVLSDFAKVTLVIASVKSKAKKLNFLLIRAQIIAIKEFAAKLNINVHSKNKMMKYFKVFLTPCCREV
tara:strand:- start:1854 stop:2093 length:240 start_codon:yes stop_codon:yes gene_type:complete